MPWSQQNYTPKKQNKASFYQNNPGHYRQNIKDQIVNVDANIHP